MIATELPPALENRAKDAIDGGVNFLKRLQNRNGTFGDGVPVKSKMSYAVGYTALPALALLECGVPRKDPCIKQAADFVRKVAPARTQTYELACAIMFLDRLGEKEDLPLIRSLALRLAAGQGALGGWGYNCPNLSAADEKKLIAVLREKKIADAVKHFTPPDPKFKKERPKDGADNSNTQFAIIGLWCARKYDLPLDFTLALAAQRFRTSQNGTGWGYRYRFGGDFSYGSMTGAGLLALAVGNCIDDPDRKREEKEPKTDESITAGLIALARHMKDPTDAHADTYGPKGALNLYFLWSVERAAVLCNLDTIGGKDWHRWGVELLLPAQNRDGSWTGRGNGTSAAVIDTSMALLFLKKADLLPDLRKTLQQRVTITDPGPDGKGVTPKKSPGEKSPGEKIPGEKSPGD